MLTKVFSLFIFVQLKSPTSSTLTPPIEQETHSAEKDVQAQEYQIPRYGSFKTSRRGHTVLYQLKGSSFEPTSIKLAAQSVIKSFDQLNC